MQKKLERKLLDTAWKSAPAKVKFLSTDEWKNGRRSGAVQIPGIHTNQRQNINKQVKMRWAQAYSAMTRLAVLWKYNGISFPTKIKLYKSPVLSILFQGCESWTLTADLERWIQAFENKYYRMMIGISTENIKQTNMYGNRSVFSPDVRSFYCQPSCVESYHGSAMSVVIAAKSFGYFDSFSF